MERCSKRTDVLRRMWKCLIFVAALQENPNLCSAGEPPSAGVLREGRDGRGGPEGGPLTCHP